MTAGLPCPSGHYCDLGGAYPCPNASAAGPEALPLVCPGAGPCPDGLACALGDVTADPACAPALCLDGYCCDHSDPGRPRPGPCSPDPAACPPGYCCENPATPYPGSCVAVAYAGISVELDLPNTTAAAVCADLPGLIAACAEGLGAANGGAPFSALAVALGGAPCGADGRCAACDGDDGAGSGPVTLEVWGVGCVIASQVRNADTEAAIAAAMPAQDSFETFVRIVAGDDLAQPGAAPPSAGPCPPGFFCPLWPVRLGPTPCPGGYVCPANVSAPTECTCGFYCPPAGAFMVRCRRGTYCGAGSAAEARCPAGSYSDVGACAPTRCPCGHKCPLGAESPMACAPPFYCPGEGATNQTLCPIGFHCPDTTM